MKIVVTASSELVGDILSDLNTRRAKIVGMDINSIGQQKLEALVPESEIIEYVNDLKSIQKVGPILIVNFMAMMLCLQILMFQIMIKI